MRKMTVYFSPEAEEEIGQYYERYNDIWTGKYWRTDLQERAANYRLIKYIFINFSRYISDNRISKRNTNRNYIHIKELAVVEYEIDRNLNEVAVVRIYFNDKRYYKNNTQQHSDQSLTKAQQRITYKYAEKHTWKNGFRLVKSNNGLYNYVDSEKKLFYPERWFNQAYDFEKGKDGLIFARVEFNYETYLLTAEKNLYKIGNVNGYTTETLNQLLDDILLEIKQKRLIENMVRNILTELWRFCEQEKTSNHIIT